VVREGLIVGVVGYAVVAVFFTVFDLLAGRGAVSTLNLLGKMVFRGIRDPAILQLPIAADPTAMVGYNFLHLFISLAVGLLVAWLVGQVEERPTLGYPVLGVLIAGYFVTIAVVSLFAEDVSQLLPWWTIVTVSTLAFIGGGVVLIRGHAGLLGRVREEAPVEAEMEGG
jgi:hypothetical protein